MLATMVATVFMVIAVYPDNLLLQFNQSKMSSLKAGEWSHSIGDCDYSCRVKGSRIVDVKLGENLYQGNTCDLRFIMELWEESPAHKAILDNDYHEALITIERSGDECFAVMNTLTDTHFTSLL